jgi:hypothetical protein
MTWRCPSTPFARGRLGFSGPYSYPVSINFCTFDTPALLLVRFVSFSSRSFEGVGRISLAEHFAQLVAQLLSFPLGCLWARTVPGVRIFGVSLNPGPFSLKEHVLITVMATVSSSSAYAVRLFFPSAAEIRLFRVTLSDKLRMGGLTDRHYCCATKILWPGLVLSLPVAARHVHATHRLLHGWRRQTSPCFPTFYESVYCFS